MQAKLSITRACQIAGLSRAAYYKKPMPASERDAQVIEALNAIVTRHGRRGFWKCFTRLRLDGRGWNKKRVHRVYFDMGLNLPRRCKKRLPDRPRQPLDLATEPNRCWALDFMHDALYCGIAGWAPAGAIHASVNLRSDRLSTDVYLTGVLT